MVSFMLREFHLDLKREIMGREELETVWKKTLSRRFADKGSRGIRQQLKGVGGG